MIKKRWIIAVILLFALSDLSYSDELDVPMTEVVFEESEPGLASYQTRILFWQNKIRIDDAEDSGDFLVFDLHENTIFNVGHEDRRILKIEEFSIAEDPSKRKVDIKFKSQVLNDAPKIDNHLPVKKEYWANNQLCQTIIILPDVLTELTQGMLQFHQVLASNNYQRLGDVPDEYQTPCYLSKFILQPAQGWQFGLPLQYADDFGYRKRVLKYNAVEKPSGLFALPEGYKVYNPL